jgi:hypothetical protein
MGLYCPKAETYLWSTGQTGASIDVSPSAAANYTVTGLLQGCTSEPVTATVTVDAFPSDSISIAGNTLTAFQPNAGYQWLNCADNTPIPDATDQTFTPSQDGMYSVIISTGACVDTSACVPVLITGIPQLLDKKDVVIAPNPTSGIFRITISHAIDNLNLHLYHASGQWIQSGTYSNTLEEEIDLSGLPAGVYFIQIMADGKFYNTCIVKMN